MSSSRSRDGRIRTGDPLNPIQVRYRAAPRPETAAREYSRGQKRAQPRRGVRQCPAGRRMVLPEVSRRAVRTLLTAQRPVLTFLSSTCCGVEQSGSSSGS